jgi:hypothetical protein
LPCYPVQKINFFIFAPRFSSGFPLPVLSYWFASNSSFFRFFLFPSSSSFYSLFVFFFVIVLFHLFLTPVPPSSAQMEKTGPPEVVTDGSEPTLESQTSVEEKPSGFFARVNQRITGIKHFEARGIERVPETERFEKVGASNYMQMTLLWFSANITANNMAVGMLGPLDYDLGFTDAALCATFGAVLGALGVAYISTFGPASGNRTMVRRFFCCCRVHTYAYVN